MFAGPTSRTQIAALGMLLLEGAWLRLITLDPIPSFRIAHQVQLSLIFALSLGCVGFFAWRMFLRLRDRRRRIAGVAAAGIFLPCALVLWLQWSLAMLPLVGFMCTEQGHFSYEFPEYQTEFYLINFSCVPDGHASLYVRVGFWPYMDRLISFNSPLPERSNRLRREGELFVVDHPERPLRWSLPERGAL